MISFIGSIGSISSIGSIGLIGSICYVGLIGSIGSIGYVGFIPIWKTRPSGPGQSSKALPFERLGVTPELSCPTTSRKE